MRKRMIDHVAEAIAGSKLRDNLQIVVIDNLDDYVRANNITYEDLRPFINLAPPFDHIWFDAQGEILRGFGMRAVHTEAELSEYAAQYHKPVFPIWCEETHWMLIIKMFQLPVTISQAAGDLIFCVAADGKPIEYRGCALQFLGGEKWVNIEPPSVTMTSTNILAILLCLSLMNSQNVIMAETKADIRDGEARVRARAGKPPLRNYYTLKIVPGKRKQLVYNLSDRQPKHAREMSREHWRRGHFRTYAPDAPLFGREGLHGTFWFSPSLVSERKKGERIEKQYKVELTDD